MAEHFPEIFKKKNVAIDARSTTVNRCILSMEAECEALAAVNPTARFHNDVSDALQYYLNQPRSGLIKAGGRKGREVRKQLSPRIDANRMMTVLFNDAQWVKDNIKAEPTECGATIKVSFAAIEDASFDVLTFIQASFDLAMQDYLNWKSFSHAAFTGIKGPWSGKVKQTAIEATYKNILNAKAELINKGVNMNGFCYVMDAKTEALLKSIVKAKGQGGFIIEDGKLDGDPYFVSHYIQQQANGQQDTANMYLGLGVWAYLAANQHGDIHPIIDPYTLADKGMMKITMRTRWSLTTLRPEAFACYKITEPTEAANDTTH